MSSKPLKVYISVTLDKEILDKVREFAEKDDRSISQYVNRVLKEFIEDWDN